MPNPAINAVLPASLQNVLQTTNNTTDACITIVKVGTRGILGQQPHTSWPMLLKVV